MSDLNDDARKLMHQQLIEFKSIIKIQKLMIKLDKSPEDLKHDIASIINNRYSGSDQMQEATSAIDKDSKTDTTVLEKQSKADSPTSSNIPKVSTPTAEQKIQIELIFNILQKPESKLISTSAEEQLKIRYDPTDTTLEVEQEKREEAQFGTDTLLTGPIDTPMEIIKDLLEELNKEADIKEEQQNQEEDQAAIDAAYKEEIANRNSFTP